MHSWESGVGGDRDGDILIRKTMASEISMAVGRIAITHVRVRLLDPSICSSLCLPYNRRHVLLLLLIRIQNMFNSKRSALEANEGGSMTASHNQSYP